MFIFDNINFSFNLLCIIYKLIEQKHNDSHYLVTYDHFRILGLFNWSVDPEYL